MVHRFSDRVRIAFLLALALGVLNLFCGGGGGSSASSGTGSSTTLTSDRAAEDAADSAAQAASVSRMAYESYTNPAAFAFKPRAICPAVSHTGTTDSGGNHSGVLTITGGCTDSAGNTFAGTISNTHSHSAAGTGNSTSVFDNWTVTEPDGSTETINGTCTSTMSGGMMTTVTMTTQADLTIVEGAETTTIQMDMTSTATPPGTPGAGPTMTMNGTATFTSSVSGATSVTYQGVVVTPMSCPCPTAGTVVVTSGGVTATVVFQSSCGTAQVTIGTQTVNVTFDCDPPAWEGGDGM